jgi:hypothetical protein
MSVCPTAQGHARMRRIARWGVVALALLLILLVIYLVWFAMTWEPIPID